MLTSRLVPHVRVLVVLALRNLRRNLRRTLLTAAAMVVGGGLLSFSFALGDGTHESWIESAVRMDAGHVSIQHPDYRSSPHIEHRLPSAVRDAAEEALGSPAVAGHVLARSFKLVVRGLASSASGARPAQIVAVDPAVEAAFSRVDEQVIEGRYLQPDDRLAAYVAEGLALGLDLQPGSRLVVQAQDAEREITGQLLRVVGVFRTGVPEADQVLMHIPLVTAGAWLGADADVTNVGVLVRDSTAADSVAAGLEQALGDFVARGEARVMGWRESNPSLASAIALDDFGNYLLYAILFTIIAFGVVNTVLMSLLHRHREFGVLQALGLTPGQTGTIVLIEGLVLTAASGLLGVGIGLLLTWYFVGDGLDFSALMDQEMTFSGVVIDPVIVPRFSLVRVCQVLAFMVFLGIAASLYPAFRAARIDVTEAMKFDR